MCAFYNELLNQNGTGNAEGSTLIGVHYIRLHAHTLGKGMNLLSLAMCK